MPKVKNLKSSATQRKVKKRPPRIFVNRKGQLFIQVGKKKFLIKDNDSKFSKSDILDILLKTLLVRRKRRKKGKVTKREKKLNKEDLRIFNEFERLNRTQSSTKGLRLPAKPENTSSSGFYNSLVRFFRAAPEDVNIVNRRAITKKPSAKNLISSAATAKKPSSAVTAKKPSSVPIPTSSAPISSIPVYTPPVAPISSPPKIFDLTDYEAFRDEVRDEIDKPGKRKLGALLKEIIKEVPELKGVSISRSKVLDMYDDIVRIMETADKREELAKKFTEKFSSIENLKNIRDAPKGTIPPPPPGPPPPGMGLPPPPGPPSLGSKPRVIKPLDMLSFTSDSEMKDKERAEYSEMKKQIMDDMSKSKVVAKRKLLRKLIKDKGLSVEVDNFTIPKTGANKGKKQYSSARSAGELAIDILDYYENKDQRVLVPSVINEYFPKGINNIVVDTKPPIVRPVATTTSTDGDILAELKKRFQKQKEKGAEGEEDRDEEVAERGRFDSQILAEAEEEDPVETEFANMLKKIKLKNPSAEPDSSEPDSSEPDLVSIAGKAVLDTIKQDADGHIYKGKGLSTSEIDKIMKFFKIRNYLGTLPANFTKFIKKYPKRFSFIMNTDPSHKKGKHWVAVHVDTVSDNTIEYYDSFGKEPSKSFLKQIKKVIDQIGVNTYLKLKINRIQEQNVKTSNCGFFCIKFLVDRANGKNFKESTTFNPNGEKELELWKNKMFTLI